jgi:hypothetical protein
MGVDPPERGKHPGSIDDRRPARAAREVDERVALSRSFAGTDDRDSEGDGASAITRSVLEHVESTAECLDSTRQPAFVKRKLGRRPRAGGDDQRQARADQDAEPN